LKNGYTSLAIYSAVYGFSSAFISLAISRMVAKWMYSIEIVKGERLIDWGPKVQTVYATVDRLSQSHGIKMPEVGVYDSAEPNAFATGPTKNRALVAVSQGLLDTMSQAEIEGVIGHEMAHVLNGDMVTMTLLQGVLNTVIIFASRILANIIAGMIKSEGDTTWIEMIVNIVLQIAFGFLAMIVMSAYSRHREYRADEDSSKMLGKKSMIAALKRLQTLHDDLAGSIKGDDRIAAMQISTYKVSKWFSTHPALEDRIAALEKRYDLA
jgi:heat shock protein HtpX